MSSRVILIISVAAVLAAATLIIISTNTMRVRYPAEINGNYVPCGHYTWDDRCIGYIDGELLFTHYINDQRVNENGFTLFKDENKIKVDVLQKMQGLGLKFSDGYVVNILADDMKIGMILTSKDKATSVQIEELERWPLNSEDESSSKLRIQRLLLRLKYNK
ncbi:MAG: hypothetical protein KF824_06880 [Fimbriimonadaceae bacterium]|nr:MAG: hypothetical protein KF824_06880 [Fimbriimonadaceae bacterium]